MSGLRVVLDTNVLVSGLAYPSSPPGRIVAAWRRGSVSVVLSPYILDELERVLPRLNHRLRWRDSDFADFIDLLSLQVEIVDPIDLPGDAVRDARDVPVLGTLLAAGADYLVTGDRDLLALGERHPVITPAELWQRHGF
ncbi:MAG: putative toxin-antitoxin system toxin component, PIN family [Polyangia bacterium]